MTQTLAPLIMEGTKRFPKGYPSPDYPLGRAWAEMYNRIKDSTEPVEGRILAEEIGPKHDLNPATLMAVLSRAGRAGVLERIPLKVVGTRGNRNRTHYRCVR